jgi:hypothetical protein
MRYLKSYENFFSNLKKFWNDKINIESDTKEYSASWNMHEINILEKYGKITEDEFEYNSVMTDISIRIKKTFVEELVGYAPATFNVTVSEGGDVYSKKFTDFDKVEKLIKSLIPESETDANKYNL